MARRSLTACCPIGLNLLQVTIFIGDRHQYLLNGFVFAKGFKFLFNFLYLIGELLMTQTSSNSPNFAKPEADGQDLDILFPGNYSELQDSDDDTLTIHQVDADELLQASSLFDGEEGETDDTSSSLFGTLPEIVTAQPKDEEISPLTDALIANSWQNLVSELQDAATPKIDIDNGIKPSPELTIKPEEISPELKRSVTVESSNTLPEGEAELQAVEAAAVVTSPAPLSLPKLELPTVQPLTPTPIQTSLPSIAPVSAPATNHASSGCGLSFRNKAVIFALLIGLIPAGVIGALNLNSVGQLASQGEQQMQLVNQKKGEIQTQILLGLLLTAAGAGILAYWLTGESSRSQSRLAAKAKQFAQSNLDTPLNLTSQDEVAIADQTLTALGDQVQKLRQEQSLSLQQSQLLTELSRANITDINEIQGVIQKNLDQARTLFGCERLIFYYHPRYQRDALVVQALDITTQGLLDPQNPHPWVNGEIPDQISIINDMAAANLTGDQRQWFDRHQVKASLSVPITRQNYPLGLLMAQHCQSPHIWQTRERQFLQQLAEELQTTLDRANLIEERNESTKQAQILKELTIKLSSALNGEEVFTIIVNEIRQALKADRVIVYRFDETWAGTVIAESVAEEFPKALGATIADPCFADNYVEEYRSGRIQATRDIFDAGLTPCHLGQLKPFEVKANLVAPINYEGNLLGLLIAHQCSGPRDWHQNEIDLFGQLTVQVGLALERSDLLAKQLLGEVEQRQIREKMQQRALELLMEVDPVNRGDLTIRAKVTEDEIGTIADSYNATIENLRRIVTQVQQAAAQFTNTTGTNEAAVRQLSNEATKQAEDVAGALERLQAMNQSIQEVAENAAQAESAVQQATKTVDQGEDAMNRTVDGILAIRETVAATAKQVKRLGESSQKISKVVNLISSFADQTNLLALNAAIEAAHAGEEGRGFAVVADEVRSLARQSAEATAEISELVASIQSETNEVVNAMEAGTEQVVAGTRLVDETRRSLNQITAASAQISELVEAITAAAVEQSQTSQSVTQTMAQVAAIADKTSSEASNVATTFKDLLAVAQSLQDTVRQFKVE